MKLLAGVLALTISLTAVHAADLRVGAAAEVITPPNGSPMAGYYSARLSEGVDDDLFAKSIVIERDGVKVAMVVCDLVTMPRGVVEDARKLIAESPGIPADRVMISATHTHTGPIVIRNSAQDPLEGDVGSDASRTYTKALPELIAKSVRNADAKLTAVHAFAGVGHEEHVSFNRRYVMKKGPVGWNPGKLNLNIDRPAGPIDPELSLVYFASADDAAKPVATQVNFACHPDTVGSQRISADYPGVICSLLSKVKGGDMVAVFANGTCGDINHIDVSTKEPQEGLKEARRIGTILAGEAIKTYARMRPIPDGALRAKNAIVPLPLPEVNPEEFEQAKEIILKPSKARMSLDRVKAFKVLDVAARKGQPLQSEVQVFALGDDVAWVAMPGEIFVELGLDIKTRSPFKQTIIVELANGSIGYVPTKRAFADGNYEPTSARCAPGSGEMLADAAVRLLEELHAAK